MPEMDSVAEVPNPEASRSSKVRSIEVEMPTSGVAIEMQLETMRKQSL